MGYNRNYYNEVIETIIKDTYSYNEYSYLSHDEEWKERFHEQFLTAKLSWNFCRNIILLVLTHSGNTDILIL